jgi:hypothetical protein
MCPGVRADAVGVDANGLSNGIPSMVRQARHELNHDAGRRTEGGRNP